MEFKKVVENIMQNKELKLALANTKSFEGVHKFFADNGYEGSKQDLKEDLFIKSKEVSKISENDSEFIAGGANGRQALAACAGIMMMFGITPTGLNSQSSAKTISLDNTISLTKIDKKDKSSQESKDYDADKAKKRLSDFFEQHIHDQNKVKEQIMAFFDQYTQERKIGLPVPRFFIFNGPNGADKMSIAKNFCQSITSTKPFIITANDILDASRSSYGDISYAFLHGNTKQSGNSKNNMSNLNMSSLSSFLDYMSSTFLHGNTKQGSNSKDDTSNLNASSLSSFLKATEGTVRVVIIDEWDKLYKKDAQGNYSETHALDETIRSIVGDSLKDYEGHHIDLNGAVFICTTNETTASLQGRIEVDPKTGELVEALVDEYGRPVLDENHDQVYGKPKKSRPNQLLVSHDPSLMSHLWGSIFYFDDNKE